MWRSIQRRRQLMLPMARWLMQARICLQGTSVIDIGETSVGTSHMLAGEPQVVVAPGGVASDSPLQYGRHRAHTASERACGQMQSRVREASTTLPVHPLVGAVPAVSALPVLAASSLTTSAHASPAQHTVQYVLRLMPPRTQGNQLSRWMRAGQCRWTELPQPVFVLPAVRAHWQALGEVDARMAAKALYVLDVLVRRRVAQLRALLDEHAVPHRVRRSSNLIAGIANVDLPPACAAMDVQTKLPKQRWSFGDLATRLLELECVPDAAAAERLAHALRSALPSTDSTAPFAAATLMSSSAIAAVSALPMDDAASASVPTLMEVTEVHSPTATEATEVHSPYVPSQYRRGRLLPDAERVSLPTVTEVMAFLIWLGPEVAVVDEVAASVADCVLHVYARWLASPTGRLHAACPEGMTEARLFAERDTGFRLPFAEFVDALEQLAYCRGVVLMAAGAGAMLALQDPSGRRELAGAAGMRQVRKIITSLNVWAPDGVPHQVAKAPEVQEAYEMATRMVNRWPKRLCAPLLVVHLRAIFARLSLDSPRNVRLATWLKLATALILRSYEGCSMLHADLVPPNWRVGRFTKTTDGLSGKVPLFRHRLGCRLGHVTSTHALLAHSRDVLAECACGRLADGGLDYDCACVVCLTGLMRLDAGLASAEHHGLSAVLLAFDPHTNAFTGDGAPSLCQWLCRDASL